MTDDVTILEEMIGRVPRKILVQGDADGGDEIVFHFTDGSRARFWHHQDCCEYVNIEDVTGDLEDLVGHPIIVAEERMRYSADGPLPPDLEMRDDSDTWTFYTFRSHGGSVDVRWHGSSNGYYSESVLYQFYPAEGTNS